jgi:hypothetical protein
MFKILLISLCFLYAVFSFVLMDINPVRWGWDIRFLFVLGWLLIMYGIRGSELSETTETDSSRGDDKQSF